MSTALLHGSQIEHVFLDQISLKQLQQVRLRERLVMVEMWTKTIQIPSEQTAQGQRDECCQQEIGDSVEVEWREGHHGDGQGERKAGYQRQKFTVAEF